LERPSSPVIRTLLLCDLVASTKLVERIGDAAAADLLARHDRAARDLLARFDGREIDKSDGFLLLFERPIEAVRFAVGYQAALRELGAPLEFPLASRVGIHVGEVVLRENAPEDVARGAKPLEVEGLAKAIAARVMSLAGSGRILLTRAAYDFARRSAVGMADAASLRWAVHGAYRLAGVDEPVEVCEVAELADAALTPPESSEKARRADETGGAEAEPLLSVLAFDNLSTDPEMQFFSDGISEEIIQRLSRGAKLRVVGRTSSFQFRGDAKAGAAGRLGCSHVLDGSVQRAMGRVRISASLIEAGSGTTLWSDRYDRGLEDVFAVQDEIAKHIALSLHQAFSSFSTRAVDPADYDLYLRASPKSYAPDELRTQVGLLEVATQRSPHFAEAWGRLSFVRAWLRLYQPYAERAASGERVTREAETALGLDPQNVDATLAQFFVLPHFGRFGESIARIEAARRMPGLGSGQIYTGWGLRAVGWLRESLEETERAYRLDALSTMTVNLTALARMAAGHPEAAVPLFEDLVARAPEMSFPVANLLRAHAFLEDWDAVDRLLALAGERSLRELEAGLDFIRAKRDPTPENVGGIRSALEAQVRERGCVEVSQLVYAAHLGLVEDAYRAAEAARLGPVGPQDDVMGPDAYRTGMLFHVGMPELRNDPRFPRLCARLGLVEFWTASGRWPDCAETVPYDFRAECAKASEVPQELCGF
jgi:TolB-like protein